MEKNGDITLTDERAEGFDPEILNGTEKNNQIDEIDAARSDVNANSDERDASESIDARRAEREEYDRLIKTRFKDFYTEDTQKMINRRFKHYKALAEKYKVLEKSASSAEKGAAMTRGELVERLRGSEGELKSKFPNFSIEKAQASEQFMTLARIAVENGSISFSQAYKLSHFDEIIASERERLEKEIEQRVLDRVRSNRSRAYENAVLPQTRRLGLKASRLTRNERAELAKRAAKGEKIGF